MGRFLARALAALAVGRPVAEVPPAAPRPDAAAGFGGFGDFGGRAENGLRSARTAKSRGFGDCGGFGERAENENQAPPISSWPEGVDSFLTRDAARLSGLISNGCDWRWCSDGGLDVVKDDGLTWSLSPAHSRRLLAEGLLPPPVLEAAP